MKKLTCLLWLLPLLCLGQGVRHQYYTTNLAPAISPLGTNAVRAIIATNAIPATNVFAGGTVPTAALGTNGAGGYVLEWNGAYAHWVSSTNLAGYATNIINIAAGNDLITIVTNTAILNTISGVSQTNAAGILAITAQQTNAAGILAITAQQTNAAGILAITSIQTNAANILAITKQQTNAANILAITSIQTNAANILAIIAGSPSNFYVGTFTGNGAGLTNLSGGTGFTNVAVQLSTYRYTNSTPELSRFLYQHYNSGDATDLFDAFMVNTNDTSTGNLYVDAWYSQMIVQGTNGTRGITVDKDKTTVKSNLVVEGSIALTATITGNGRGLTNYSTTNLVGLIPASKFSSNVVYVPFPSGYMVSSDVTFGGVWWDNVLNEWRTGRDGKFWTNITSAAIGYSLTNVTAAYTAVTTKTVVLANTTLGGFTVTLPATAPLGFILQIKNSGSAGTLTVSPNGAQKIDGAASPVAFGAYSSRTLVFDGTDWWVL